MDQTIREAQGTVAPNDGVVVIAPSNMLPHQLQKLGLKFWGLMSRACRVWDLFWRLRWLHVSLGSADAECLKLSKACFRAYPLCPVRTRHRGQLSNLKL